MWKNIADLHIVYYYPPQTCILLGFHVAFPFCLQGAGHPPQKKKNRKLQKWNDQKNRPKAHETNWIEGFCFFSKAHPQIQVMLSHWKINILTPKNGGLLQMIFLFSWVIFRFQP